MSADRERQAGQSVVPEERDNDSPDAGDGFLLDDDPEAHWDDYRSPEQSEEELPAIDTRHVVKLVGWGLIGFAVLIFLGTRSLPYLGVLLAAGIFVLYYVGAPQRLKREQIIDRWDSLIDGAQGQGEQVVTTTVEHIEHHQLPHVTYEQTELSPGILRGMTGAKRPFLVVSHTDNRRLRPYRMYVLVRDYGTSLQVSWCLAYHRTFFERFKPNPLVQLDLFDEQDLRAYVTAVHHCFIDSVVDLVTSLGQDASRLDRSSKGFLGIS